MPFHESMRYDYPLTPRSVVLDCGAYQGNFSKWIWMKYACQIHAFEPCRAHFEIARSALADYAPEVRIQQVAIGGSTRNEVIRIKGDMTGMFVGEGAEEQIAVIDVLNMLDLILEPKDRPVDLIKLNVEGMEYEILERIIGAKAQTRFVNFQVQFHQNATNAQARWEEIRDRLLTTHELTYDAPFCWENYRIK